MPAIGRQFPDPRGELGEEPPFTAELTPEPGERAIELLGSGRERVDQIVAGGLDGLGLTPDRREDDLDPTIAEIAAGRRLGGGGSSKCSVAHLDVSLFEDGDVGHRVP